MQNIKLCCSKPFHHILLSHPIASNPQDFTDGLGKHGVPTGVPVRREREGPGNGPLPYKHSHYPSLGYLMQEASFPTRSKGAKLRTLDSQPFLKEKNPRTSHKLYSVSGQSQELEETSPTFPALLPSNAEGNVSLTTDLLPRELYRL